MTRLTAEQLDLLKKPEPKASGDSLKLVRKLSNEMVRLNKELEALDAQVKERKERLRVLAEVEIPEAMAEAELTEIVGTDGFRVVVEKFCHVSQFSKPEQLEWLRKNDHAGLIKSGFSATLKKGSEEVVKKATAALKKLGITCEVKSYVHQSTATAWVKEMLESGQEFPLELFSVYVGKVAKLHKPNEK